MCNTISGWTLTGFPINSTSLAFSLRATWMVWICCDTADKIPQNLSIPLTNCTGFEWYVPRAYWTHRSNPKHRIGKVQRKCDPWPGSQILHRNRIQVRSDQAENQALSQSLSFQYLQVQMDFLPNAHQAPIQCKTPYNRIKRIYVPEWVLGSICL